MEEEPREGREEALPIDQIAGIGSESSPEAAAAAAAAAAATGVSIFSNPGSLPPSKKAKTTTTTDLNPGDIMSDEASIPTQSSDTSQVRWPGAFSDIKDREERMGKIDQVISFMENILSEGKRSLPWWYDQDDGIKCALLTVQYIDVGTSPPDNTQLGIIIKCWETDNPKADPSAAVRLPFITDGLDERLTHFHDYKAFEERINDLFKWHDAESERNVFLAPYFPMVQSSGMGKTRLLTEYHQRHRILSSSASNDQAPPYCMTLLCVDTGIDEERLGKYFDKDIGGWSSIQVGTDIEFVRAINDRMNSIIAGITAKRIVLLFDEAQGLMTGEDKTGNGCFTFRAIRWWLRQKREQEVVAVFAGTTVALSNLFPPDRPLGLASRHTEVEYKNFDPKKRNEEAKKSLYDPFLTLHTIGIFRHQLPAISDGSPLTDFGQAAMYGRPLFAYYQMKGELQESGAKYSTIKERLALSRWEPLSDRNNLSYFSILGSRVQMGDLNHFTDLSKVVAGGYACLVGFDQTKSQGLSSSAQLAFLPDPVCAAIAMRYMNGHFSTEPSDDPYKIWVQKAAEAFTSHLCRPSKGDLGEVFVALYMILCGDILRKQTDESLNTFSIPFDGWFNLLRSGGKHTPTGKEACSASISFIQVARNDLRSDSWFDTEVLRDMYKSGMAYYSYSNCPGVDIVASVAVRDKNLSKKVSYHPLLVSVKNWKSVAQSNNQTFEDSTRKYIENTRGPVKKGKPSAIVIIVLVGLESESKLATNSNEMDPLHKVLPDSFGGGKDEDVYHLVRIPNDDKFGISEAVKLVNNRDENSELYASHFFLASESNGDRQFCRSGSKRTPDVKKLRKALRRKKTESDNQTG